MSSRNTNHHGKMKTVHLLSVMTANRYHPYMKSESVVLEPTLQKSNSQSNFDSKTRGSFKALQERTTKQINYLKQAQQENIQSKDQLRTLSESYFEPRNSSVTGGLTSRSNRSSMGSQQAIPDYSGDANIQVFQSSVSTAPEEVAEHQKSKVAIQVFQVRDSPEKDAFYQDEALHAQYWIQANRQIPQFQKEQKRGQRSNYSQKEITQTILEDLRCNQNILRYQIMNNIYAINTDHKLESKMQKQPPQRHQQFEQYTNQQISEVISLDQDLNKPLSYTFRATSKMENQKQKIPCQSIKPLQYSSKQIQEVISFDQETNKFYSYKYMNISPKTHTKYTSLEIQQAIYHDQKSNPPKKIQRQQLVSSQDHPQNTTTLFKNSDKQRKIVEQDPYGQIEQSNQDQKVESEQDLSLSDPSLQKAKKVQFLEDQPQQELLDQQIGIDLKSLMKARKEPSKKKTGKSQRTTKSMTSTRSYLSTHSLREVAEDATIPLISTTVLGSLGLYATQKILGSQKKFLGILPGIAIGVATYYKIIQQRNQEQQEVEGLSDEDFDEEEVKSQN